MPYTLPLVLPKMENEMPRFSGTEKNNQKLHKDVECTLIGQLGTEHIKGDLANFYFLKFHSEGFFGKSARK